MSTLLADILKNLLSLTVVTGIIAYVAKAMFDKYLDVRVEKFKGDLNLELENHKSYLTTLQIEHQIKYTKLYEQRGQKIAQLNTKLYELEKKLGHLTSYAQGGGLWYDDNTRQEIVVEFISELKDFLELNRIYFSDKLCIKVENILSEGEIITIEMHKVRLLAKETNKRNQMVQHEGEDYMDKWLKAEHAVQIDINDARMSLANECRTLIGVQ